MYSLYMLYTVVKCYVKYLILILKIIRNNSVCEKTYILNLSMKTK